MDLMQYPGAIANNWIVIDYYIAMVGISTQQYVVVHHDAPLLLYIKSIARLDC